MSYYAKIVNDTVTQVIISDKAFVDSIDGEWVQTSYDTAGNVHRKGGTPLRKNYAGIGYKYDRGIDAFLSPKPYNSWVLDQDKGIWNAPIARPLDENKYIWSEENSMWESLNV